MVFTKIGSYIGDVAKLPDTYDYYNFSQNVAGASIKDKKLSSYILAFFLSKFGKLQILRSAMVSGQGKLELDDIRNYKVPCFTKNLTDEIFGIFNNISNLEKQINLCYNKAEKILYQYLDFPKNIPQYYTVKTLDKSLFQSGRLDAEYYQTKYEIYERSIKNFANGYTTVKETFDLVTEKCYRNLNQYRYIEIGDINVGNGSYIFNLINTKDLPDNAKIMTKVGDILVSTVRPNRGAVAILEENNLLVSGAFTVLRQKSNYSKELLQVLLRTPMYRDWLLKFNVGTSYPVIKSNDILNLQVPLLNETAQNEISDKIQETFRLRNKIKQLLNTAIKAVEMAIEKNESYAIKWLDKFKF